jgi:hypothetical protein
MAVIDAYVNTLVAAGKKDVAANITPGQVFALACTFEIAIADSDESLYRVACLPSNLIPYSLTLMADDALDVTTMDVGLYLPGAGGAVVDADCFASGLVTNGDALDSADLAANALASLPIDDIGKPLWNIAAVKLAGTYTQASHPAAFDLVVTAKSDPGAISTVSLKGLFIQG